MIVLIIQIVAGIAAYYFMKKKLAERYTTDFIKSVKWILISPIVQIVIFVPACISALQITKTVDDVTKLRFPGSSEYLLGVISNSLSNDNLSYGGITSMASGSTYSDVELSASITMLVGAVAAVLFIIMTVWQFRGIFGQGQESHVKTGHKVSYIAIVAVEACLTWTAISLLKYMSLSSDSASDYISYIFLLAVIVVLGVFVGKFCNAVDLYYEQREADMAAEQTVEEQPSTTAAPSTSKVEQLQELKKMLDQGILTQQEFDNEKRKLLDK